MAGSFELPREIGPGGTQQGSLPVTTKKAGSASQQALGLQWGVGEMQGWRPAMEDAHIAMGSLSFMLEGQSDWADTALFGVFDGHGGEQVAKFCAAHLPRTIACEPASDVPTVLRDSFLHMDHMLTDLAKKVPPTDPGHPDRVGSTAVTCLINRDTLVVANAGDSRAVLSRGGCALELSNDHKPSLQTEADRINRAGGFVVEQSCGPHTIHRVNGNLSLSRSIGDLRFKKNTDLSAAEQIVSCVPEVQTCKRQHSDEFMVIACDGVWDVFTSEEVVRRVHKDLPAIRRGDLQPSDVVCNILDECLTEDPHQSFGKGADNMTMILVVFDEPEPLAPASPLTLKRVIEDCVRFATAQVSAGKENMSKNNSSQEGAQKKKKKAHRFIPLVSARNHSRVHADPCR
jgi:serine/threonine protein phosphatase PrpC